MKRRVTKLTLSRETLRHLDARELGAAHGGNTFVACTKQACTAGSYCYQCITADATDCPSCAGC